MQDSFWQAPQDVLSAPRDRLGRLDFATSERSREARESLRLLAKALNVPGCVDTLEQCEQVLRAALLRPSRTLARKLSVAPTA